MTGPPLHLFVPVERDGEGNLYATRPEAPAGHRYAYRQLSHDRTRAVFELVDALTDLPIGDAT